MPTDKPKPPRALASVTPIRGWVQPMRCPQCGGQDLVQVDLVECVYPVIGVRRPRGLVLIDIEASSVNATAIGAQFYRCDACDHEWPLDAGTLFAEPEEAG